MALPTIPSCWPARNRILERQIVRQREQEARFRQQWDVNSRYFKEFDVWSSKQAHWSSRMCYQQSMQAYEQQKLKEEKKRSLAERRKRLCKLLAEERTQLTKELKEKRLNVALRECEMRERSEKLKSAREQERKTVAEQLLYEHWKKTNPRFREIESALHRKHVVNSWESQLSERKQQETAEKEEKIRFENQYELARRLALERIKREEEEKRLEDKQQAEALLRQMEELKLKEMEATKLKKEQENLLRQQWELGLLEEERRSMEEYRKKAELGRFLRHQYNAQLNRRAQQIQEELEADKRILLALLEKEDEHQRQDSARREQAAADAAWMKQVIEDQLEVERVREAELQLLYREEAKQMWEKREAEWEKERQARDRLMKEVLTERQHQLQEKIELNRRAQEEALKYREQLIRGLEEAREETRRARAEEAELKTSRKQELEAQIAERHLQDREEYVKQRKEEEETRLADQLSEELVEQEARLMSERGFQSKPYGHPKVAWN
ncbi:trichoplein keratin filament-binding protein isoform X1 [Sarcophilus harrisii]|uniref:trichoplein keratin filament-binding protein isoform X1 n=2 Tax=Sarcophilus harrisii TaxID=9305 RepID=UPI001301DE5C|nr:trichoplein keratin filament-binding protein isoform X1 [Sarcophilus harrisii]XP_031804651.1 trichoplein keratin filament-binding protein isoform X1 [Sarcophilus harrisii]